jgi:glutaminyl-tRNA synthetase
VSDPPDTTYQFERTGYFVHDSIDSGPDHLVFNRTVTLRDSWARAREAAESGPAQEGAAKPKRSKTASGARGGKGADSSPSVADPRPDNPEAASRYDTLREEHRLAESEASVLAQDAGLFALFGEGLQHTADEAGLAKWIVNEVPRVLEDRPIDTLLFGGRELARLVELVSGGEVSGRAARDVLSVLAEEGGDPDAVIEAKGLGKVSDASTLGPMVVRLVEENPVQAQGYRDGKKGLMGFFVGQVMKETNGAADPEVTQSLLLEALTQPVED